jgi:hypothetical protein
MTFTNSAAVRGGTAGRGVRRDKTARQVARALCFMLLGAATMTTAADPAAEWPLERDIFASGRLGEVPYGFSDWRELFAEQERLNAAAQRILDDPDAAGQLADVIASPGARRLQVYWKGDVTESTRRLLAELRQQVPIELHAARYSRSELLAAGRRALALDEVVEFAPRPDGSGLDIGLDRHVAHRGITPALLARLSQLAPGMQFNAAVVSGAQFAHARDNMPSPYYGGGRIIDDQLDEPCSLGVPFSRTRNGVQELGWITASHCTHANLKGGVYAGSSLLGPVHLRAPTYDMATILTSRNDIEPRIYVGRPSGQSASVPIGNSRASITGNVVYSSGASTGLNGPLLITGLGHEVEVPDKWACAERRDCWVYEEGFTIGNLTRVRHLLGLTAAADGDSGGPVFSFHPDGTAVVRGITSQKDDPVVTCPSDHRMPKHKDNTCNAGMFFIDIGAISTGFQLSVITTNWPR